jgi:cyclase
MRMHIPLRSRAWRGVMVAGAIVTGAALAVAGRAVAQQQNFDNVQIDTVKVRDNVYMLVGAGGNTTVMTGEEGVLVVDTQFAPLSTKIIAAIRAISQGPIRYVVNTHMHGDHIGGNEAIAKAGRTRAGGNVVGDLGAAATSQAAVIAHENVLTRLSAPPAAGQQQVAFGLWPTETFIGRKREFLFNGEAVQIIHQPKAHTDGDSVVFFRKSDVVSTGDLFTTVMYPFIDVANGGTITGEIAALNAILDITVPSNVNEGGTMVIPGHGRLSDEQDVIEYRDMATIVRDRIKEYVKRGMTLDQVKAKKPTLDFDPRYGTDTGFWTTSMFIETIYKEMVAMNPPAPAPASRGRNRNQTQKKGSGE